MIKGNPYPKGKDRYERIQIVIPIGTKDIIKSHANAYNLSMSNYIRQCINNQIEEDKKKKIIK